ncbi:MAG TPA: type II toxin-antitoxin system HigB family toxin [Cyclobacteriaceae bacterium]
MNIIKRKAIEDFIEKHGDSKSALLTWFATCKKANWENFNQMQMDFPEAFPVGDRVVFDIKGNRYRLVARILFLFKQVQIKWIGTHAEYDRIDVTRVNEY